MAKYWRCILNDVNAIFYTSIQVSLHMWYDIYLAKIKMYPVFLLESAFLYLCKNLPMYDLWEIVPQYARKIATNFLTEWELSQHNEFQ